MALQIETQFKLKGYIESLIGGRTENQDSAGALETAIGTVIVVCDGMGGLHGGKTASMLAVQTIIDDVAHAKRLEEPSDVLEEAIRHANEVIIKAGREDESLQGMGTTVAVVIVNRQSVTTAHVGDSRIYQIRDGKKVFRTMDHSQVFELVKIGAMTEEEARCASNSNIILKALGVSDDVKPDIATLPYLSGDRFVLCTDGFWRAMSEKELLKMVSEKGSLEALIRNATSDINLLGVRNGGVHDNLTAAIFDIGCDSKLKIEMRKSIKILIAVLTALLAASVILNICQCKRVHYNTPKAKAATDLCDSLACGCDTTACFNAFVKAIDPDKIRKNK